MRFLQGFFPFKPFKSKRGALRALDELQEELTKTEGQQNRIRDQWKTTAAMDELTLALHRQGAPTLRWRTRKTDTTEQRFITLFAPDSPFAELELSEASMQLLSEFEHERIIINAKSKALFAAMASMKHAIEELNRLPALATTD